MSWYLDTLYKRRLLSSQLQTLTLIVSKPQLGPHKKKYQGLIVYIIIACMTTPATKVSLLFIHVVLGLGHAPPEIPKEIKRFYKSMY